MINIPFAGPALLILFYLLFIFHLLILAGKIPIDLVWAGKIKSRKELIQLESISLLVLAFSSTLIARRINFLNFDIPSTIMEVSMWILFAFFVLNTIGNLSAKNPIEKYGFGILTLVISLLVLSLTVNS